MFHYCCCSGCLCCGAPSLAHCRPSRTQNLFTTSRANQACFKNHLNPHSVRSIKAILVFLFYNHSWFLVPIGQFCVLLNTCFLRPPSQLWERKTWHITLWTIQHNKHQPCRGLVPPRAKVKKFPPWLLCRKRKEKK